MPRLPPSLLNHARRLDRHLPLLLRECRDLTSALNELRWMKEAVLEKQLGITTDWEVDHAKIWRAGSDADRTLRSWVRRRACAEPLQYILGTQPFGELEIKCKPGVLIPRPETEIYTTELARFIQNRWKRERRHLKDELLEGRAEHDETLTKTVKVADFCTGTGCIALLLHSLLRSPALNPQHHLNLQIRAFDISHEVLSLSKQNLEHNINQVTLHESARSCISFEHLDVLALSRLSLPRMQEHLFPGDEDGSFDVIISNPPYISPAHFRPGGATTKSVRKFEPKLALVPPAALTFPAVDQADQFYPALIRIAAATRCKLLIMEVGDTSQALRVLKLCKTSVKHGIRSHMHRRYPIDCEVWNDDGHVVHDSYDPATGHFRVPKDIQCRAVAMWIDPQWNSGRKVNDEVSDTFALSVEESALLTDRPTHQDHHGWYQSA